MTRIRTGDVALEDGSGRSTLLRWRWLVLAVVAVAAVGWTTRTALARRAGRGGSEGTAGASAGLWSEQPPPQTGLAGPPNGRTAVGSAPAVTSDEGRSGGTPVRRGLEPLPPPSGDTPLRSSDPHHRGQDVAVLPAEPTFDRAEAPPAVGVADHAAASPGGGASDVGPAHDDESGISSPIRVGPDEAGGAATEDGPSRADATPGRVPGDESAGCPASHPYKGNASSRIYHRPGESSYAATIPELCFATEEDAVAAGFRPRAR